MLTQTSETAIRFLVYLALNGNGKPLAPAQIAEHIHASPSYLAKITGQLAKAGILRSFRGALGGVRLSRDSSQITLLQVIEACQGTLIGTYCESMKHHPGPVCAYHQAMVEVHQATLSVLSRWTLKDLSERPTPSVGPGIDTDCKINVLCNSACKPSVPAPGVGIAAAPRPSATANGGGPAMVGNSKIVEEPKKRTSHISQAGARRRRDEP